MYRIFDSAVSSIVKRGDLNVTDPAGVVHRYGDGSGVSVGIKINATAAVKIVADPDLYFGECYVNGDLVMTEGTIYDVLSVFLQNTGNSSTTASSKMMHGIRRAIRRLDQYNPVSRSKANVSHHYDLSRSLYDLFLDSDRQYSCAYFEGDDGSLERAQLAKKRHIASKLMIQPGMRVLDIGSGWGGLAIYLAEVCGADVVGVTLSEEQLALSRKRVEERGLSNKVSLLLRDYRTLNSNFDRIVSVGMFEHVGVGHYREFFQKVSMLLDEQGVALLHSINRSDGPGATNAWIKKYIFPGGYIPALSEVVPHLEQLGLCVTDVEILRLHYAETLKHWASLFNANRDEAKAIYDERFCRMWEFYLAASECAFRFGGMNNFQIQFVKDQEALPLTRDYMVHEESRLRSIEGRLLSDAAE
ncbi:cyclopropane-fatty-acyl-phospholipid synthase family protein [Roseibium sp. SCP14]|uniref:cyclopropane-fatty-acyl-phospholipid synthase family protein n=1 Tax=Roseibium sp. SCP14 TaxID=3141375 RepID=UPI003339C801